MSAETATDPITLAGVFLAGARNGADLDFRFVCAARARLCVDEIQRQATALRANVDAVETELARLAKGLAK